MNISLKLFLSISSIVVIIERTTGERKELKFEKSVNGPLGLIKNNNDNSLKAATLEKYNRDENAISYFYDDSKEEFKIACPSYTHEEHKMQREWNKRIDIISPGASVLFLVESDEMDKYCKVVPTPSIKTTNEECNVFGDKFYHVGFPVKLDKKLKSLQDITFITTYKICYSFTNGKLYTIHHIDSPNLLLLDVKDIYLRYKRNDSELDKYLNKKFEKDYGKKYFLYDLVGIEDMPNDYYRYSTSFLINFVPIPEDEEMLKGMIMIDNFVRLLSKANKKRLTLYSGTYEFQKASTNAVKKGRRKKNYDVKITLKSIWRIIMDTEQKAVMTVTQYSTEKCDKMDFICPQSVKILKEYTNGGCSYLCPINADIIELLGLRSTRTFTFSGYLELGFPKMVQKESNKMKLQKKAEFSIADASNSTEKNINIEDFMRSQSFMSTLITVDPALAQVIQNDMLRNEFGEGESGHDEAWPEDTYTPIDPGLDLMYI